MDLTHLTGPGLTGLFIAFGAACSAMALRTLVITTGATFLVQKNRWLEKFSIYRCSPHAEQFRSELVATLKVIPFDAAAVALAAYFRLIHTTAPTWTNMLLTFAVMFVWFEVWFYVTHRLMHTQALYFIHKQHHVAKVTDPLAALSFSLAERAILIVGALGFAALISRWRPIPLAGLGLYFFFNYVFNVLGHANVELFPAGFARTWFGRLYVTATYHSMHHARYHGNYGLFTQVLDRLCATVWGDYEQVHERVREGTGLRSFGERLASVKTADETCGPRGSLFANRRPVRSRLTNAREGVHKGEIEGGVDFRPIVDV